MTASVRCPHCRQLLAGLPDRKPAPPEAMVIIERLTRPATNKAHILKILAGHFRQRVLTSVLVAGVYPGRDGGPHFASETIKQQIWQLRRDLKPLGLTIIGERQPPGGSSYRLDWLP